MFWKVHEILCLIGTKIFEFGQKEAEKIEFKDIYLISESVTIWLILESFFSEVVLATLKACFSGIF